eukprot:GHVQ01001092.1.p1 GENE.GHVQ01001092.1~~GHVQ01001092.1.p1  ORF type:complete len:204 (-),score=39.72 GHVQ01001092.1:87-698(-)
MEGAEKAVCEKARGGGGSEGVCYEQLLRALSAAVEHHAQIGVGGGGGGGEDLLGSGGVGWVNMRFQLQFVFTAHKTRPIRIELPHSIHTNNPEVCLMVPDPQRKWKDLVKDQQVTCVQKVIGFSKLRKKYCCSIDEKRKLRKAYDVFFAHHSLAGRLPEIMGKDFILYRKLPISVKLPEDQLKKRINYYMRCAFVYIRAGQEM